MAQRFWFVPARRLIDAIAWLAWRYLLQGLRIAAIVLSLTVVFAAIFSQWFPPRAGPVFDVTHSYTAAFELVVVLDIVGALVSFSCMSYEKERSRMVAATVASA